MAPITSGPGSVSWMWRDACRQADPDAQSRETVSAAMTREGAMYAGHAAERRIPTGRTA
jgi:hypothetical protein